MAAIAEIFWTFFRLGLIAFGGPVAHLGYYRRWFVEQRQWMSDGAYAQLVALGQMLPGPSSSQTGFAIGIHRAGLAGGLAAWVGFTLPSAVLMIGLGIGLHRVEDLADSGWLNGLKLAAIAVVAQALYGMARQLCPDLTRALIAVGAALGASVIPGISGQLGVMMVGGLAAMLLLSPPASGPGDLRVPMRRRTGLVALGLFMLGLGVIALPGSSESLWGVLYRSGALVFGGGHVVLPLLETGLVTPGLIDNDRFLAGYGAAQAVPGPIFTFGGYLGAQIAPGQAVAAGLLGVALIFAPGLLLMTALLPFWHSLSEWRRIQQALLGINAAVVGLLAAVLWHPLLTRGITEPVDAFIALAALAALMAARAPSYLVVAACAIAGEVALRLTG